MSGINDALPTIRVISSGWRGMRVNIVTVYNLAVIRHPDSSFAAGLLLGAVPVPLAVLLGEGVPTE